MTIDGRRRTIVAVAEERREEIAVGRSPVIPIRRIATVPAPTTGSTIAPVNLGQSWKRQVPAQPAIGEVASPVRLRVRRRPSIVTPFDSGEQAGYCGASARIKIDDEQFAALFNELQARGDKGKLRQLFGS